MYKYLVVECNELGDQWECDADRKPICLVEDYSQYNKRGYEIYEIKKDGTLDLIRNYDDITDERICVCWWNDEEDGSDIPDKIIEIKKGDRDNVTKSLVKKIKQQYNFKDTVNEIYRDISCSGSHGEEIDGKWVVFGETFDDWYPKGY